MKRSSVINGRPRPKAADSVATRIGTCSRVGAKASGPSPIRPKTVGSSRRPGDAHTLQTVAETVMDYYKTTPLVLYGVSRHANDIEPRHICYYLARQFCGMSYPAIAQAFGRDHSSVIHAVRKIEREASRGGRVSVIVKTLTDRLEVMAA